MWTSLPSQIAFLPARMAWVTRASPLHACGRHSARASKVASTCRPIIWKMCRPTRGPRSPLPKRRCPSIRPCLLICTRFGAAANSSTTVALCTMSSFGCAQTCGRRNHSTSFVSAVATEQCTSCKLEDDASSLGRALSSSTPTPTSAPTTGLRLVMRKP